MSPLSTLQLVCPAGHFLEAEWDQEGRWPDKLVVQPCAGCATPKQGRGPVEVWPGGCTDVFHEAAQAFDRQDREEP